MALETVNKNTAVKFKLGRNNGRISTKMSEIDKICLESYVDTRVQLKQQIQICMMEVAGDKEQFIQFLRDGKLYESLGNGIAISHATRDLSYVAVRGCRWC
eukprot:9480019-Pyramimonas_sp.AAC.1